MTKTEEGGFGWQVWHRNGTVCPHGTVPVQRVEAEAELSQGKYGPLIPDAAERATKGHQASFFFISSTYINYSQHESECFLVKIVRCRVRGSISTNLWDESHAERLEPRGGVRGRLQFGPNLGHVR